MADNRMFLLHRPTGKAVYLARLGAGSCEWSVGDPLALGNAIKDLMTQLGSDAGNDFCLALEVVTDAPHAFGNWTYTEERGIMRTLEVFPDKKPEVTPPPPH